MSKTKDKPSYPRAKPGSNLAKNLERARRSVAQWPFGHQRAERTWTRDELLMAGMDLEAEGKARKKAARKMEPGKHYSNQEAAQMTKEARDA